LPNNPILPKKAKLSPKKLSRCRSWRRAAFLAAVVIFIAPCQNPAIAIPIEQVAKAQNVAVLENVGVSDVANEKRHQLRERHFAFVNLSYEVGDGQIWKVFGLTIGRGNHSVWHRVCMCGGEIYRWGPSSTYRDCSYVIKNFDDSSWCAPVISDAPPESSKRNAVPLNFESGLGDFDVDEGGLKIDQRSFGNFSGLSIDQPQAESRKEEQTVESGQNARENGDRIARPVIPIKILGLIFAAGCVGGALLMWVLARRQDRMLP
jgi:hypothetical protein